jgi:hypothetical protein
MWPTSDPSSRREGWLVTGSMNGAKFDGWIGFRWGRYFIIVDAARRKGAKVEVGDPVEVGETDDEREGAGGRKTAGATDHGTAKKARAGDRTAPITYVMAELVQMPGD